MFRGGGDGGRGTTKHSSSARLSERGEAEQSNSSLSLTNWGVNYLSVLERPKMYAGSETSFLVKFFRQFSCFLYYFYGYLLIMLTGWSLGNFEFSANYYSYYRLILFYNLCIRQNELIVVALEPLNGLQSNSVQIFFFGPECSFCVLCSNTTLFL